MTPLNSNTTDLSKEPLEGKRFQLVVLGATGFTGKEVVRALLKEKHLDWAIAGRSQKKLTQLQEELARTEGDYNKKEEIIADVNDHASLIYMANQADVVMNCVGPYRFYGEQVVKACVETATDYIDLSGEPEFMAKMYVKYHLEAEQKRTLIIHACAFDSVPADLGVCFNSQQFAAKGGVAASVESFLRVTCPAGVSGHYATWEAAVHGFGSASRLSKLRKQFDDVAQAPVLAILGPKLPRGAGFVYDDRISMWRTPFLGSDSSVVRASQRSSSIVKAKENKAMPTFPQYAAYVCISSRIWVGLAVVMGSLFGLLAGSKWGRALLLQYPKLFSCGLFSHEGPTEAHLKASSFSMTFFGRGYKDPTNTEGEPDMEIVTRVTGPEAGYVATPLIFIQVAHCLLEERSKLPVQGGCFTPGAVFANSTLVERCNKVGVDFTVLKGS